LCKAIDRTRRNTWAGETEETEATSQVGAGAADAETDPGESAIARAAVVAGIRTSPWIARSAGKSASNAGRSARSTGRHGRSGGKSASNAGRTASMREEIPEAEIPEAAEIPSAGVAPDSTRPGSPAGTRTLKVIVPDIGGGAAMTVLLSP
jgi:hypothetical protein